MRDPKVNLHLDQYAVGAERAAKQSMTLLRPVDHEIGTRSCLNVQQASSFGEGDKVNKMAVQYESSLFSSSLSELFSRKMRLSSNIAPHGYSVETVASHYEEEGPFESLEEVEAQTIGNLLPNDDDLFSGVTDGLDHIIQPGSGDDMDELDFFNSVGGMDLGDDGSPAVEENSEISAGELGVCNGAITMDHPSRTLIVRNINSDVQDSELQTVFEQYGDIHTLYTACKNHGFVMISYYDIRAARNAMKALQNKLMRHKKLSIHYSSPNDIPLGKDLNQGTLVVFNLDASVSSEELHQIFGIYGEIKEIHETTEKGHKKFVEFYDIRAAEASLQALNRSNVTGKQIKVEPSHPGASKHCLAQQCATELEQDGFGHLQQQSSPPNNLTKFSGSKLCGSMSSRSTDNGIGSGVHSTRKVPFLESVQPGISSSVPNSLPSLVRVDSVVPQSGLAEFDHSLSPLKFGVQTISSFHPHSLPEYHAALVNGAQCNSPGPISANVNFKPPEITDNCQFSRVGSYGHSFGFGEQVFGSAGSGSSSLPTHNSTWSNSYHPQPPGIIWPNSPSMVNGICNAYFPGLHGLPRSPSHMVNTGLPIGIHHVGSAPAVDPSLWDRRHAYAAKSHEVSGFHLGSLGSMRISNNSLHPMEYASHNIFAHVGGNSMEMAIPSKKIGFQPHQQRSMIFGCRGQMVPMMNSFDIPNERVRSRRNEGSVNQTDKKQYELDIDRILQGEDTRTTLMIKNIPNKYTSKMLLAAIDECHKGTYDFIYLPIDFKNKCNVGYAFINMTDPSQIIPFYQSFNGKKWEKFNSEKVASLAYARIQGKAALIAHFQNSSLMNEDKRCRPILFNTDGPSAGDQVPFPMGVNDRTRPGKVRNATPADNYQGTCTNLGNVEGEGEGSSNGDNSVKESE
ncbi:protein MEI2-like 4 isoform X2 [Mangifera indica]|nr:protein MEI2-like 4 isoform X2 [Mangifera indica]XP_044508154.1 protein MEI2-like 4 isoform X2 [Mangifera indica]